MNPSLCLLRQPKHFCKRQAQKHHLCLQQKIPHPPKGRGQKARRLPFLLAPPAQQIQTSSPFLQSKFLLFFQCYVGFLLARILLSRQFQLNQSDAQAKFFLKTSTRIYLLQSAACACQCRRKGKLFSLSWRLLQNSFNKFFYFRKFFRIRALVSISNFRLCVGRPENCPAMRKYYFNTIQSIYIPSFSSESFFQILNEFPLQVRIN